MTDVETWYTIELGVSYTIVTQNAAIAERESRAGKRVTARTGYGRVG